MATATMPVALLNAGPRSTSAASSSKQQALPQLDEQLGQAFANAPDLPKRLALVLLSICLR